ncbi:Exocyst component protein [Handroanthus impetiginosus]|uniref:Exocyst subunit Exo70 family protein n=1 Tax=Handroanthus impetiginosus TaxID=429701 RepID=A0A2G9HTB0_9LAMI|nr:Exocyst component protein [Handroanthus impetiginosus]
MDADRDKPLPEKSHSFSSRDDPKTESKEDNKEHQPEPVKPNVEQDAPEKDGVDSPSAPEQPSEGHADPEIAADAIGIEIKEEDLEHPPELKLQESPPPPLPLDLSKLSEEIDQYISALSTSKGQESIPPDVPNSAEQYAILVEAKVADYDSIDSPIKWSRLTEEDSASFLEAVTRISSLSKALSKFSSEFKYAYSINRVGGVLQRAMSYLEEEFRSLVEDYKIQEQSTSSTSNQESEQNAPLDLEENDFPGYSEEILSDLVRMSKTMIAGGHEQECCQVYFVARRNVIEESLHKLGFEKYSIDDVQKMQWESLEREIVTWIKTFKQFTTIHFSGERKLSDKVFPDQPSLSESLFCSLSHGITIQLLNFAEAVALTKRAAEKLFKFLDIYEALRDILPMIESLFPEERMNEVKTEASIIKGHLGEAMISIFVELENSIKADSGKTPVPGGAIHPLTRYTMNYLKYACEYKETLEQVFREHQKIERADSATGSDFSYNSQAQNPDKEVVKQSPFQTQIMKVMDLLDANLDGKSKLYKDHSLSLIFMMNNGRYMLQKIRGSNEISSLMGDSWCRKRSSDLRQYHKSYQRETWGKLLSCLQPDGLMVNGKVVKPILKERFKSFNVMFDEIHKTQSTWVVSDEQLQSELRVSISNMVIPAYRSFLGRFSQVFTPGRQTEKYVKYQPEDIETYIDELFDGNGAPAGRKKQ